jgi:hypothetical protein
LTIFVVCAAASSSDLDVRFANVDLSQVRLLLIQAQNDLQVSFAKLSTAVVYAQMNSLRRKITHLCFQLSEKNKTHFRRA